MKKVLALGAVAMLMLIASGCDTFRKMAGRPTSEDIELKRDLIEAAQLAEQARLDSIEAVRKHVADSLAAHQAMLDAGVPIKTTNMVTPSVKARMGHRYYVIVGAFGNVDNAKRMQKKAADAGIDSELIPYRNGVTAVGLCPSDDLASLYEPFMRVREQDFCPKEVWVIDME